MAAQAHHWLSPSRAKDEIRIPQESGDLDLMLLSQIQEAVSFLEERTELPLLDRTFDVPGIVAKIPLVIPRIAYLKAVTALHYRTSGVTPYSEILMPGQSPVLERETPDRMSRWRYWPDVELPSGATRFRVTVEVGMDADAPENASVKKALILLVREAFEGGGVAEKMPAWERIIRSAKLLDSPNWRP